LGLGGLLVAVALLAGLAFRGRILPGVRVAGVAVGGLTRAEAARRLAAALPAGAAAVTLRDPGDGRTWTLGAADLGIRDSATLAEMAYRVGREPPGRLARLRAALGVWRSGHDLATQPDGLFDGARARQGLEAIAGAVDIAPRNADVRLVDGQVVTTAATVGRQLDVDGTLAALAGALTGAGATPTVDIAILETAARIGDPQNVDEAYRTIVSSPLELRWRNTVTATIPVEELRSWASIQPVRNAEGDEVPSIVIDETAIRRAVEPLAARIDRPPAEARFTFNQGRAEVRQPGAPGYRLNVDRSVQRVIEGLYTQQRVAELEADAVAAGTGADTLDELQGLQELARAYTSFAGAPSGRLQNILVAADRFNGLALAPGQSFSFNEALGPVTAAAGYDLAFIEPVQGLTGSLGGGIEQVATTAFRAAFWAGLPITARQALAYRSGWVEPPVGLDAAVDGRAQDLRFTNDRDRYLLMQTEMDPRRQALAWVLYGSQPVARVEAQDLRVTDLRAPGQTIVRPTPLLPAGSRVPIESAREGATATVRRAVFRSPGDLAWQEDFVSHYQPWPEVILVGTGPAGVGPTGRPSDATAVPP
jgi:vancomycin resistance protein YoaR